MGTIGFKTSLQRQEEEQQQAMMFNTLADVYNFEPQSPQDIGLMKGIEVLREYFKPYNYPALKKEDKDKMFFERLRKVKERYFDPI